MKKFLVCVSITLSFCALFNFFCPSCKAINVSSEPVINFAATSPVDITSKTAILIEVDSGKVLFSKNENEQHQIASMTKLMTILLTLEEIEAGRLSLEQTFQASENASGMGGSQAFIDTNASYSIDSMLKSVIIASANDGAVFLAEAISGSESAFVNKMNEKAKILNLDKTLFANSSGLNAPNQFSTASDVSKMLKEVIKFDLYKKYSAVWMDELIHPSGRKTELVNTNRLSKYFEGSTGGKTGFTDEALFCLSSSAKRGNMQLVAVVMGAKDSKTRFNEGAALLSYGFANFEKTAIVLKDEAVANVDVLRSKTKNINLVAEESYFSVVKKGEKHNFDKKIEIKDKIVAPVILNENIGKMIIIKEGEVVAEINLKASSDASKITMIESLGEIIHLWK